MWNYLAYALHPTHPFLEAMKTKSTKATNHHSLDRFLGHCYLLVLKFAIVLSLPPFPPQRGFDVIPQHPIGILSNSHSHTHTHTQSLA